MQVEVLLEWLLRRGREMNATSQLGPQALGATAGALARLQEAQRQQQQQQLVRQRQQQQQQQQQQVRSVRERVLEEEEAKRADAVADRRQLMQQLVDAAVAQRSRLSPQVRVRLQAACVLSVHNLCSLQALIFMLVSLDLYLLACGYRHTASLPAHVQCCHRTHCCCVVCFDNCNRRCAMCYQACAPI
jgi:Fe2+ transport system protein B